jgi:hypothetical protein
MNRVTVGAIVRKDVKTIIRNRGISIPLLVVPLVIRVALIAYRGPVLLSAEHGTDGFDCGVPTLHRPGGTRPT